jgi:hypothetical protein
VFHVGGLFPTSPTIKTLPESSHAIVGSVITVAPVGSANADELCHDWPPSVEYWVASVKSYVWMLLNFFDAATICDGLFGLTTRLDSLRALLTSES